MSELTPDELADRLPDAVAALRQHLMQRIVLIVEGNVRRRTRVKTGHLRRSWASVVERSGERGRIGTTVRYARRQRNRPLDEGLADSQAAIRRELAAAGVAMWEGVVQ